jgi:hypothetical protein
MNVCDSEVPLTMMAKTCGCKEKKNKKVTYRFVDAYHSLCIDKKDIISAELQACERLLNYAVDEYDKKTIETEISQLKMALDLMP